MLTRCGYVVDRHSLTERDIGQLVVTPRVLYSEDIIRPFRVFKELQDHTIAVPRYWAQGRLGRAHSFEGVVMRAPGLVFVGELRSGLQKEASRVSVERLQQDGGGVLCLPTGEGKTVIALHAACAIGVRTLVVVHKRFLADQWAERVSRFVPSARVGRIQQKNVQVDGCDIVIGMLQSIAMRDYRSGVFEGFGLVILDEVHVVPAPVFSRALLRVCAPCMLGMSATPARRDGMSFVINWFIGPMFIERVLEGRKEVSVMEVPFPCGMGFYNSRALMANAVTRLCSSPERNGLIARVVRRLVADGHKVIVLSDRRGHCTALSGLIAGSTLYIGGMKGDELKRSEAGLALFATYAMAKEGLDIPDLTALVLASPRSDVAQACGRVLHGSSRNPVIVDIVDQWHIGRAQFMKRMEYYRKSGFAHKLNHAYT